MNQTLKWLEEKGVEFERDDGIDIELDGKHFFVKCSYLGFFKGRIVLCIDFASPTASEPVKRFMESYTRIRRARYTVVVAGDKIWTYDVIKKEEVEDIEVQAEFEVKPDNKDFRIAAAYYNLIHCQCGVGDEGNSVCGLPLER